METILTIKIPDVFENLEVLGNISGKQAIFRKRFGGENASGDGFGAKAPSYFLSEPGTMCVWDEAAEKSQEIVFSTQADCENGKQAPPVFFETRYIFRAKCSAQVEKVRIYHRLASVTEGFTYKDGWFFGDIDFINVPGRFTLALDVTFKDKTSRRISFRFTVVSVKMDVEQDYKNILNTIEKERKGLVQNFLSKTFGDSGFDPKAESTWPSWYAILENIFDFFVGACEKIVNNPHRRYENVDEWRRPDQIKRWSPQLVNRFYAMPKDRRETMWLHVDRIEAMTDTLENRFVLYTIRDIAEKLSRFAQEYLNVKGISDECRDAIRSQEETLEKMAKHPFFRGVGVYAGGAAQSLVLQKRDGYAQVLTAWLKLGQALSPEGKGFDIGYRPLSALYEFWTFLATRNILRELLPESDYVWKEPQIEGALEQLLDTEGDSDTIGEKTLCKMSYVFEKKDGTRRVMLAYQQNYGTNDAESNDAESFAVVYNQRPDIVLSIEVGEERNVYTYLFDAKYRIDDLNGKDASPRDAIDDMHRYRDAILYRKQKSGLTHEIIGAYVLFPGRKDESYDYQLMRDMENIGAFPLLPDQLDDFKTFIQELLQKVGKHAHLGKAISTRGTSVVVADSVESFVDEQVLYCGTWSSNIRFAKNQNGDIIQHDHLLHCHYFYLSKQEGKVVCGDETRAEQKKFLSYLTDGKMKTKTCKINDFAAMSGKELKNRCVPDNDIDIDDNATYWVWGFDETIKNE